MERGDVFLSPQHEFDDGGQSPKLLILLNDPQKTNSYVFVLTTSQRNRKIDRPGCYSNDRGTGYYVVQKGNDWFEFDYTFVLFHTIKVLSMADVLKESLEKGNLKHMARLKEITMRSIINCMSNSPHVAGYKVDLIKL